ncbi:MAG: type transport system permease protein [Actinomycetota bacterium]|nr:type transport system permease protein [Actinomycetota bacterium]
MLGEVSSARIAALWSRRQILTLLVTRDLKVKYADSVLGYFWSVLEPMLMAAVYWTVFTQIFSRSVGREPYLLFLVTGIFPWYWANGVLHQAVKALNRDSRLVRSTNLPREIWVFRTVASLGVEFVLTIPVIAAIALAYHNEVSINLGFLLLVPLAVLIETILLVGVGLILAPVAVVFPDIERVMRAATRFLFYASPVLYGVQDVPHAFRNIYIINPLAGIFDLYRSVFFSEQFAGWTATMVAALNSCLVFAIGAAVFAGLERRILKEI